MLNNLKQTIKKSLRFWDNAMYLSYLDDTTPIVVNYKKTTVIDLKSEEY